jgi:hypothetical protein
MQPLTTMPHRPTAPALPRGGVRRRDDVYDESSADEGIVVGVGTWTRRSTQRPDEGSAPTMRRRRRNGDGEHDAGGEGEASADLAAAEKTCRLVRRSTEVST